MASKAPEPERRSAILGQIKAICPKPMTPAELNAAADYLEKHPDALPLAQPMTRLDGESRVCRGEKI